MNLLQKWQSRNLTLKLLSKCNSPTIAAAVGLLEELERPLAFRDASKEKLECCDRYFDVLVKEVKSKWRDGAENRGT